MMQFCRDSSYVCVSFLCVGLYSDRNTPSCIFVCLVVCMDFGNPLHTLHMTYMLRSGADDLASKRNRVAGYGHRGVTQQSKTNPCTRLTRVSTGILTETSAQHVCPVHSTAQAQVFNLSLNQPVGAQKVSAEREA